MAKPSSTNCPKAFRAAGFPQGESGGDKKTDSTVSLLPINDFLSTTS